MILKRLSALPENVQVTEKEEKITKVLLGRAPAAVALLMVGVSESEETRNR